MLCMFFFFLMIRRPPRSTRTDTLFPYTTLFRSGLAAGLVELHHAGPPWVLALDPGRRAQGVDAVLEVGGSGRRRLPRLLADIAETVERRDALAIPGDQRIFVPRLCGDLGVADDHAGCFADQCVEDWFVLVPRCLGH